MDDRGRAYLCDLVDQTDLDDRNRCDHDWFSREAVIMPANCDCPVCGSRNTKSLSIIHESGLRHGQSTRNSVWASLSGSVWAGRSSTESRSSSQLSDNAAPPGPQPWGAIGVPTILAVFIFQLPIWVIPLVMISVAVLYGSSNLYVRRVREIGIWHRSFRCLRCGETFAPTTIEPSSAINTIGGNQTL